VRPYRDWQYSEGCLQVPGTQNRLAPGFWRASSAPSTIIQSGSDTGNRLGTAVWINGDEVTLMAELEAGWYRYISQWTFHTNGTIKPRFGFAGVSNECICNVHHHHAYWRFDFDIGGSDNNFVQQYASGGVWNVLSQETHVFRGASFPGRWRVGNRSMRPRYEIRPGPNDGRAMASPDWPFSVGDVWFLRYDPARSMMASTPQRATSRRS
jgi:hypothetical protein